MVKESSEKVPVQVDLLGELLQLAAHPEFVSGGLEVRQSALEKMVKGFPDIELAYITDDRGIQNCPNVLGSMISLVYDGDGVGSDRSGRAWFHIPARLKRPFTSKKLISIATNRLCITLAVPILNTDGTLNGVLAVDMGVNE